MQRIHISLSNPMTKYTKHDQVPGAKGCDFPGLRKDEHLELVIRRHWIVILFTKMYLIILAVITWGLMFLYGTGIPHVYIHLIIISIWMYGLVFAFIRWINDELDIFIITNQRIIGLIQEGFLSRKSVQASIRHVQEVNAQTQWLLGSMLHFGPLYIQTASETTDLIMPTAANTMKASRHISNMVEKAQRSTQAKNI